MQIERRVRAILDSEAEAIKAVSIDASYGKAVELIETCAGKIITTGMGKAGFVAHKFAAILSSTATPAVFIHPAEAAHGDLGMLAPGDCIVAFSTSGKTREVLEFIQLSRRMDIGSVVGITSHTDSGLRELSDVNYKYGRNKRTMPIRYDPNCKYGCNGSNRGRPSSGVNGEKIGHSRTVWNEASWGLSR
jgi:arabinose-5-phosphate isomerase